MTQDALGRVIAGCGYVVSDGTEKTCGDINGSGQPCIMYQPEASRCLILGPNMDITPSMTCTQHIAGDPLGNLLTPRELVTPEEVGLTETQKGGTCSRCDERMGSGQDMMCDDLTKVLRALGGGPNAVFKIEPRACCNLWKRDGVESVVK
jgi:hypothetical protein